MDKMIFFGSLIGMLGLGSVMAAPAIFRFVKGRVRLPTITGPTLVQPTPTPDLIAPAPAPVEPPPLLSGSDQRPPKAVAEYLTALRNTCPGASMDALYSMAMAGCSLFEAAKIDNTRLLKLAQEETK
jgi:hypothetical protein